MVTGELDWMREPYSSRTPEEQAMCDRLIEEYVANNNCRYNMIGDIVEPTAQPTPINKHNFTPVERITLDYEGKF